MGLWILLFLLFEVTSPQCCLEFSKGTKQCLKCPESMHVYRGNCIFDVENCFSYSDGFACDQCEESYTLKKGTCVKSNSGVENFEDIEVDPETNIKTMILIDYGKTKFESLREAKLQFAVERTFQNGTKFIVIYFEQNSNYYELVGEFSLQNEFVFEIVHFIQLEEQPVFQPKEASPKPEEGKDKQKDKEKETGKDKANGEVNEGHSLNYRFLNFEERQKNQDFLKIDNYIRENNEDLLNQASVILGAYAKQSGFKLEFRIIYEAEKYQVYESHVILNKIRNKIYIISFGNIYFRK